MRERTVPAKRTERKQERELRERAGEESVERNGECSERRRVDVDERARHAGAPPRKTPPKSGREAPTTQGNFGGPIAKVASRFWDNAVDLESEAPKLTLGWFPSEQKRTEEFKHFGNESSRERRCKWTTALGPDEKRGHD